MGKQEGAAAEGALRDGGGAKLPYRDDEALQELYGRHRPGADVGGVQKALNGAQQLLEVSLEKRRGEGEVPG